MELSKAEAAEHSKVIQNAALPKENLGWKRNRKCTYRRK